MALEPVLFEDHDLDMRAEELEREAEKHRLVWIDMRKEAAIMRARAERMRARLAEAPVKPAKPRFDLADPLMASAALAAEDLGITWQPAELGLKLGLRDEGRVMRLVLGLEHLGKVARQGERGYWRTIDPDEAVVRDGVVELGTFTRDQLAEHLGWPAVRLTHYLEEFRAAKWITEDEEEEGTFTYVKPTGPVLPRERRRPPEKAPPAYTEAPARGEAVYAPNHGERGRRMSQPGQKHKMKLRDQRRETMAQARKEAAEARRAKAQKDPYAAKRAKNRKKAAE
jgi:hypothetical protein